MSRLTVARATCYVSTFNPKDACYGSILKKQLAVTFLARKQGKVHIEQCTFVK